MIEKHRKFYPFIFCLLVLSAYLGAMTNDRSIDALSKMKPVTPIDKKKVRHAPRPTFLILEYGTGFSSLVVTDIRVRYGKTDLLIHNVVLQPEYYPWWESQTRKFKQDSLTSFFGALTEPYYALRANFFFPKHPQFGVGIEQTHFKVFLTDLQQNVLVDGTNEGTAINQRLPVNQVLSSYSVSHGINHVVLKGIYRQAYFKTEAIPDGILQPYLSVCLGTAIPHVEIGYSDPQTGKTMGTAYSYQASFQNFTGGFSLGVRFVPFRHFGLYTEYKYAFSLLGGMQFDKGPYQGGIIQSEFTTSHLQFGISILI